MVSCDASCMTGVWCSLLDCSLRANLSFFTARAEKYGITSRRCFVEFTSSGCSNFVVIVIPFSDSRSL